MWPAFPQLPRAVTVAVAGADAAGDVAASAAEDSMAAAANDVSHDAFQVDDVIVAAHPAARVLDGPVATATVEAPPAAPSIEMVLAARAEAETAAVAWPASGGPHVQRSAGDGVVNSAFVLAKDPPASPLRCKHGGNAATCKYCRANADKAAAAAASAEAAAAFSAAPSVHYSVPLLHLLLSLPT